MAKKASSEKDIDLGKVTICRNPGALSSNLHGEAVILDMRSSTYYELDKNGTRIWEILEKENSFDAIVARLLTEYLVGREQCRADARQFIHQMLDQDLIELASISHENC